MVADSFELNVMRKNGSTTHDRSPSWLWRLVRPSFFLMKNHWSNCAIHNETALPAGERDCGLLKLGVYGGHGFITFFVSGPRTGECGAWRG